MSVHDIINFPLSLILLNLKKVERKKKNYKTLNTRFLYKHHFYKQRQAEIDKKSSKF